MRPLLLPGLLDAARHNAAHGRPGARLFESAHVYRPSEPLDAAPAEAPGGRLPALERHHLAVLVTEAAPGGWRSERRPADFFAARALLEAVLEVAGVEWLAEEGGRSFLHPGRAASIVARESERKLGWLGELHPLVAREWDVPGPVAGFELDVEAVLEVTAGRQDVYRDVTSFPAVLQDIAVVVPESVPAVEVEEAVRAGGGDLLAGVEVFDLYTGRAGRRGEQVAGAAARVQGVRPHPDRRGGGAPPRGDRARAGRDRGAAPCLSRAPPRRRHRRRRLRRGGRRRHPVAATRRSS